MTIMPTSEASTETRTSNIETIQSLIESVKQGDIPAFQRQLAEDVRWEYHPTGNTAQDADVPYMRLREGPEAAAGFIHDIEKDFELHWIEPRAFLEGDGHVAVLLEYELTVHHTGKRIHDQEIHLYDLDANGKVKAFRHFLDTAKAIEAHTEGVK
jgi:ketosteroid isomerase-like protein